MSRVKSISPPSLAPVNFQELANQVFQPVATDRFVVLVDTPGAHLPDSETWQSRRSLANEWRASLAAMEFDVAPLATYEATGAHNAPFPTTLLLGNKQVSFEELCGQATVLIAPTEFSATAPIMECLSQYPHLRAASMPGVNRDMLKTGLAADYGQVNERAQYLRALLNRAVGARVRFDLGQECYFDLRFRKAMADGGLCPPDMPAPRLINLPAGEAFKVPYEGEHADEPSDTIGLIPVLSNNTLVNFFVQGNKIDYVIGDNAEADRLNQYFEVDPARRNIAEVGFGCNPRAIVRGNILEDEKAGFHVAYGRSDHLGGTVGVSAFSRPENVVHQDLVYAPNSPISAERVLLIMDDGSELEIISGGLYTVLD